MAKSDVSAVTNLIPTVNEGFTTTVASPGVGSGGATLPLTSVSGLVNGSVFVGIVEPGQAGEQTMTGIVDTAGSQITSVKWTRGTNAAHAAGVTVVDYVTGTALNMITKHLAVEHTQAGRHNMTSPKVTTSINDSGDNELFKVTATGSAVNEFTVANAATGAGPTLSATGSDTNIDINLTPKGTGVIKIGGNTVTPGAWQAWTPTFTNWTVGTGGSAGTVAYYAQVGKTVCYHIRSVLGTSGASVTGPITFTLPVNVNTTMNNAITEGYMIGQCKLLDASTAAYTGYIQTDTSSNTKATVMGQGAGGTYLIQATTGTNVPFSWGANDLFIATGSYEAA